LNKDGCVTFTVKANFNDAATKARISAAIHKAQMKLDAQVLADSNYFIPIKTHTMENSSIESTKIGTGVIVWCTNYARRQYYGLDFDHSKQSNPNACAKWFEAAKSRKMEQWRKLIDDTIQNS
jgi:hypothetical protein